MRHRKTSTEWFHSSVESKKVKVTEIWSRRIAYQKMQKGRGKEDWREFDQWGISYSDIEALSSVMLLLRRIPIDNNILTQEVIHLYVNKWIFSNALQNERWRDFEDFHHKEVCVSVIRHAKTYLNMCNVHIYIAKHHIVPNK